ncbi:MAG TPA: hypothetical protein GXX48_23865 [Ochrobactrum intermedium]|uniref:Uncharacterized protein n=1 Tax=Brucella intermedia TaxID=94625 RepID=A0A7V6PGP1_9HYPH|nr:hypothetical protein [Brucella intermedia]HHV70634.1 hypothetical protein [Brucella intermedia]
MDKTKSAATYAENMQAFAKVLENSFPNIGFALMLFDQNSVSAQFGTPFL